MVLCGNMVREMGHPFVIGNTSKLIGFKSLQIGNLPVVLRNNDKASG